jgi:hypothetical protein
MNLNPAGVKSEMMKTIKSLLIGLSLVISSWAGAEVAGHRLSAGLGVAKFDDNSSAYLTVSGEYEYRLYPALGMGMFANYIFSNPNITLVGVPEIFLHPLTTDWYINAAPIAQFGSGRDTQYGVRVGTRAPLTFGVLSVVPSVNVDFINGQKNWFFGLGVGI